MAVAAGLDGNACGPARGYGRPALKWPPGRDRTARAAQHAFGAGSFAVGRRPDRNVRLLCQTALTRMHRYVALSQTLMSLPVRLTGAQTNDTQCVARTVVEGLYSPVRF